MLVLENQAVYRHTKTQNDYTMHGVAECIEEGAHLPNTERVKVNCTVHDGKTISLFKVGETFLYVSIDGTNEDKVLYSREGVLWLRPMGEFVGEVEIDGQIKLRFQLLEVCKPVR